MSKDLYTNKKHAADIWAGAFVVSICLVIGIVAVSFGYWRGCDVVRKEAVEKGYGVYKDGYHWKSRRAIEQGGRG